jgi:hypothetical protein
MGTRDGVVGLSALFRVVRILPGAQKLPSGFKRDILRRAKEGSEMLCEEADYVLEEAKKGEYDEELFNEAKRHIEGCERCRKPFDALSKVGELPCVVIPQKDSFASREQKLRAEYPAMFDQPELQPGEVCLSVILVDAVGVQMGIYRNAGLTSVRHANKPVMGTLREYPKEKFPFYAIFAKLSEYFEVEDRHLQRKSR